MSHDAIGFPLVAWWRWWSWPAVAAAAPRSSPGRWRRRRLRRRRRCPRRWRVTASPTRWSPPRSRRPRRACATRCRSGRPASCCASNATTGARSTSGTVEEDYVNVLVYPLTFTDGSFRMIRWAGGFTVTLEHGLDENETRPAARRRKRSRNRALHRRAHQHRAGRCGAGDDRRQHPDREQRPGPRHLELPGRQHRGRYREVRRRRDLLGTAGAGYTNTFLHEMGHVMGLGHSPWRARSCRRREREDHPRRVPAARGDGPGPAHDVSAPPGRNRPPDKDGALAAQSSARPVVSVIRD